MKPEGLSSGNSCQGERGLNYFMTFKNFLTLFFPQQLMGKEMGSVLVHRPIMLNKYYCVVGASSWCRLISERNSAPLGQRQVFGSGSLGGDWQRMLMAKMLAAIAIGW